MAEILTIQQLKALGSHKYSSEGTSITEPALQVFWRWLVEQMPLWVAPNLITITGLVINVGTSLLLMYYSPDARTAAPSWVYFSCAIGLFIYQCLDAIDGKQARRTGSSSPLGELFDHGCDAVSTVFVSIATCCAMGLGFHPPSFYFICFTGFFLFYCAHWQTYVSGTLRFGRIDVTEGQLICVGVFLLTSSFGLGFWTFRIPLIGLNIYHIPVITGAFGGVLACSNYFKVIFTGGRGRNGATVANTSVLFPALPIGFVEVGSLIYCGYFLTTRGSMFFEKNPCLYTLAFGIFCAKVTCRLVVAHMTKSELAFLDSIYFGPILLFLNQYFNYVFNEYLLLWVSLIYGSIDLSKYSCKVCQEIATYLHISVFKIPYSVSTETSKSSLTAVKNVTPSPAAAAPPMETAPPAPVDPGDSHPQGDPGATRASKQQSTSSPHARSLSPHSYARRSIHEHTNGCTNGATTTDDGGTTS